MYPEPQWLKNWHASKAQPPSMSKAELDAIEQRAFKAFNEWHVRYLASKIGRQKDHPGRADWYKGMPSPNPAGKPRGLPSKHQELRDSKVFVQKKLLDSVSGIMDVMVTKALAGDSAAAAIVVSRVLPTIKSQIEKVTFTLDADQPVSKQVEQVLTAISKGEVAPDVGKKIIEAVQTLAQIRAVEELEQRIKALEDGRTL